MTHLRLRRDDCSLQVTTPLSQRFYLRVDLDASDGQTLVFSDFLFSPDETDFALEALAFVDHLGTGPVAGMHLVFGDIYPVHRETGDDEELCARHTLIAETIRVHADRRGLPIEDICLIRTAEKFATIVALGPVPIPASSREAR